METEDFGNWSGLPSVIKLARTTCANVWQNRERLLQNERSNMFGSQNGLRMTVAQILFEISLLSCVLSSMLPLERDLTSFATKG